MPTKPSRARRTRLPLPRPLVGLGLAAALSSGVARAEHRETCHLELRAEGLPSGTRWAVAFGELRQRQQLAQVPLTCRRLSLVVHTGGATVRYRLADGRLAERGLQHPSELLPTVEALSIVALPSRAAPPPGAAAARVTEPTVAYGFVAHSAMSAAPALGLPSPAEPADRAEQEHADGEPAPEAVAVRGALQLGARSAGSRSTSPLASALLAVGAGRAELGVTAGYELGYRAPGGEGAPDRALSLGVLAGLRQRTHGPTVLAGGQAQVGLIHGHGGAAAQRAEARLGGYAGVVFEDALPFALRTQLGLDWVPGRVGQGRSGASSELASPSWGVSVSVGVELGGA